MATKTSKTAKNTVDKLVDAYIDYVLTEQKEPASIYAFAKHLGIEESEFYQHFNHFSAIETSIWNEAVVLAINSLKASAEFNTYTAREKVLGFFYTLIEVLNKRRSFFVYSLGNNTIHFKTPEGLKIPIMDFAKEVVQEGLAGKELEERKFLSDRYHEAVWLNTLFILKFWIDDKSQGFEKTDAAIEKSVNLMIELMGKSALDSMLDLGKFLFQNGLKSPFKM